MIISIIKKDVRYDLTIETRLMNTVDVMNVYDFDASYVRSRTLRRRRFGDADSATRRFGDLVSATGRFGDCRFGGRRFGNWDSSATPFWRQDVSAIGRLLIFSSSVRIGFTNINRALSLNFEINRIVPRTPTHTHKHTHTHTDPHTHTQINIPSVAYLPRQRT